MIILAILTGLIALAFGVAWIINYKNNGSYSDRGFWLGAGFIVFGVVWFIATLGSINFAISAKNLTGYIYSSNTTVGYTHGHIRFSENAGQDVQPEFCAKADSEVGRKIAEYAGSGKKVRVTVPPYFYLSNNPFACGTTNTKIEEIK